MDGMVEENGNAVLDPLVPPSQSHLGSVSPQPQQTTSTAVLATSAANLVTFIPAQNMQVNIFHHLLPPNFIQRHVQCEHLLNSITGTIYEPRQYFKRIMNLLLYLFFLMKFEMIKG